MTVLIWATLIGAGYLAFLIYIARYHPDIAATEGATYVQTRQLNLAAKGRPNISYTDVVADPQNPTQLNTTAPGESGG